MTDRLAKLEKLLALDPADGFVLYGIAQEHAKAGNHATAIETYDRLLSVEPTHCYAFFFKARSLAELGKLPDARAVVESGLKAARQIGDAKALNELSSLQMELDLK